MRPMPGDDAFLGRSRAAADNELPTGFNAPTGPQMTYFVGDESAVDAAFQHQHQQPSSGSTCPKEPKKPSAVGPVGDSASASANSFHHEADNDHHKEGKDTRPSSSKGPLEALKHEDGISTGLSSLDNTPSIKASSVPCNLSQPMTPIFLGASGPASILSSMSSRRNSLSGSVSEDGLGSQPPTGVEEIFPEEGQAYGITSREDDTLPASMMESSTSSAPQLIMPSIKMPSRRPFTDEGKSMGRLKVLIAGDSGVGKTSLIKAVVQSCDHIVHVDPIAPSSLSASSLIGRASAPPRASKSSRRTSSSKPEATHGGTRQISEIYASTKPYPEWWSEMDDLRLLKRRKSLGDAVLDRNICFVDTPGYGTGPSSMETISPVVQYVEAHLQRINTNSLSDGDVLNLIGGDGGVQVDVVFYMVSHRLRPVDIHYLQQLSPLTNIIVLLSQADLMSAEQIGASKNQICSQLKEADIRLFSFAVLNTFSDSLRGGLYAVSSAAGSDHDTMDASLLMSPDYVQPLIPTELAALVEQVFSTNGVSWLRHAAARKYIQWRRGESQTMRSPISLYQPRPSPMSSSYAQSPYSSQLIQTTTAPMPTAFGVGAIGAPPTSYALARVADHTQREERLAQIRLANWAADLQRSLANERAQYETLARNERAFWLTEKLNECVQEGTLVPLSAQTNSKGGKSGRGLTRARRATSCSSSSSPSTRTRQHQDPLGLLEVAADLRRRGLLALELLGSLGVLSGLALWLSKHYWHLPAYDWMIGEWDRFWYGAR